MLYSNWQHLGNSWSPVVGFIAGPGFSPWSRAKSCRLHIYPAPQQHPYHHHQKKREMDIIFKKQYDRCCWPGNYGKGINTVSEGSNISLLLQCFCEDQQSCNLESPIKSASCFQGILALWSYPKYHLKWRCPLPLPFSWHTSGPY